MSEQAKKEERLQQMLREIAERSEARKREVMGRVVARWLREGA